MRVKKREVCCEERALAALRKGFCQCKKVKKGLQIVDLVILQILIYD